MKRYAVYYAPRDGAFAARAANWLGRDATRGAVPHPDLPGIDAAAITTEPRRYGFHGTLRAPFRPADGLTQGDIMQALSAVAAALAPVTCTRLRLEILHGFLALTPEGQDGDVQALGAAVVRASNPWRAPLTEAEVARRRPETLTPEQRGYLAKWGYPFVMEEFRFHLTLTNRLAHPEAVAPAVLAYFAPALPCPFVIEDLCLFGEDADGVFHLLHRYALTG
jgi:hypothetical protein